MKTLIAFVIAAIMSSTAHAGDYESAVIRQQACDKAGKLSQISFKSKKNKKDKADMLALRDDNADSKFLFFAITYGLMAATSSEDAYMRSWAYCMDN